MKRFFYIYFTFGLILWDLSTVSAVKQIPKEVLMHLRNSTTLSQVMNKMNLRGHFPTNNQRGNSLPMSSAGHSRSQGTTRNYQSNRGTNTFVIEYEAGRSGIEVIEDPIQSQDSCKVVNVCAPLQLKKEANIFYFPECIDMPQCLGGCCDNSHNCHPLDTQTVRVKVSAWKYDGLVNGQQTFSPHEQIMVDIQRHMRCGCELCINKPECDTDHMLVGCKCLCRNHHDSLNCRGDRRYWSDETCSCECSRTWCPNGQVFSTEECKCLNLSEYTTLHPTSNVSVIHTPLVRKASSKLKLRSHGNKNT